MYDDFRLSIISRFRHEGGFDGRPILLPPDAILAPTKRRLSLSMSAGFDAVVRRGSFLIRATEPLRAPRVVVT